MTAMVEMKMNKKKLPSDQQRVKSIKQSKLSHATVCLLLSEPRFDGKQASCRSRSTKVLEKNQKQQNIQRFFNTTASADLSDI